MGDAILYAYSNFSYNTAILAAAISSKIPSAHTTLVCYRGTTCKANAYANADPNTFAVCSPTYM
jgi:hypothetical protein